MPGEYKRCTISVTICAIGGMLSAYGVVDQFETILTGALKSVFFFRRLDGIAFAVFTERLRLGVLIGLPDRFEVSHRSGRPSWGVCSAFRGPWSSSLKPDRWPQWCISSSAYFAVSPPI